MRPCMWAAELFDIYDTRRQVVLQHKRVVLHERRSDFWRIDEGPAQARRRFLSIWQIPGKAPSRPDAFRRFRGLPHWETGRLAEWQSLCTEPFKSAEEVFVNLKLKGIMAQNIESMDPA